MLRASITLFFTSAMMGCSLSRKRLNQPVSSPSSAGTSATDVTTTGDVTFGLTLADNNALNAASRLAITKGGLGTLTFTNTNSVNEGAAQTTGNVKTDGTADTNGDGTPAQNTTALTGSGTGSYGTVALNADGAYTYTLDNANATLSAYGIPADRHRTACGYRKHWPERLRWVGQFS